MGIIISTDELIFFQMLWFYSRNTANVMIDWWDMADMGMSENGVYPPHVELGKMIF